MNRCLILIITCHIVDLVNSIPIEKYSFEQLTGDDIRYPLMQRNAYKPSGRWINAEVPYLFDWKLPADRIGAIRNAIEAYHKHTCVRFIPKTSSHTNYIKFMDGGGGNCYSYIGRQGGSQDVSIGDGCQRSIGVILHEMAHALGFIHEHNRPDRDSYVNIRFDRINLYSQSNFKKNAATDVDLRDMRYDYLSVMHYGRKYFSSNGGDTVVTLDPAYQEKIGQRINFSVCDLEKINRYYDCINYINPANPCKIGSPNLPPSQAIIQPQTAKPSLIIPSPNPCSDDPTFKLCRYVNGNRGLCHRLPGAFLLRCKKSCNNCDNSKCYDSKHAGHAKMCRQTVCSIQSDANKKSLAIFCPLSCGVCKIL